MARSENIALHRQVDSHDLGPQQLDLYLYPHVADGAAHAVRAQFTLATAEGPARVCVEHPSNQGPLTIAPGTIQLVSSKGSASTLYTFGATLRTSSEAELSVGRLESAAPVLWIGKSFLDNDLNPIDLVVDEFQAWLSILRARSTKDMAGFYRRLSLISPFLLYLQALVLAERALGEVQVDERSERYWRSHQIIHGALNAARARPATPKTLPNLELTLLP